MFISSRICLSRRAQEYGTSSASSYPVHSSEDVVARLATSQVTGAASHPWRWDMGVADGRRVLVTCNGIFQQTRFRLRRARDPWFDRLASFIKVLPVGTEGCLMIEDKLSKIHPRVS